MSDSLAQPDKNEGMTVLQEEWKQSFANLPEISTEEAVRCLRSGTALEGKKVAFVNLDRSNFDNEIRLKNCHIVGIVARGATFKAGLWLEHCLFTERVEMSALKESDGAWHKSSFQTIEMSECRFEESLTLRTSEIHGAFALKNCYVGGPVVLDKAVFAQDVFLTGPGKVGLLSAFRAEFGKDITIKDYEFTGHGEKALDLNDARVRGTLTMAGCSIASKIEFKKAHIGTDARQSWYCESCQLGALNLTETYFFGDVYVNDAKISGPVVADTPKDANGHRVGKPTMFAKNASFVETQFQDKTSWTGAVFKDYTYFKKCDFQKGGIFNQAEFERDVSFWETISEDSLHFRKTHFKGCANFGSVHFAAKSSFNEAVFEEDATFFGSEMAGDVFFSSAVFHHNLVLRNIQCKGGLGLQKILVDGNVNVTGAAVDDRFILSDSTLNGSVLGSSLEIGTWGSLANCMIRGGVNLAGLKVGAKLPEAPKDVAVQPPSPEPLLDEKSDADNDKEEKTDTVEKKQESGDVVPGSFYCTGTIFHDAVEMSSVMVRGSLYLDNINGYGEVELNKSHVYHSLIFSQSYFRGLLRCENLLCEEKVISFKARYKEEVSWNGIKCQSITLLHSSFDGGFTIRGANIADYINLTNADVDGKADFFRCRFQRIFFANFLVDYFGIHREMLGDILPSEKAGHYKQAKNEYGILKQAFHTQNYYAAMDWAYYRFCRANRIKNKTSWKRPLRCVLNFLDWLFLDLGFGYGTRPMNIAGVAAAVVLLFASVFWMHPQGIVGSSNHILASLSFGDAVYLSLSTFAGMNYGDCGPYFGHWLKHVFSIEGLVGIFLITLFVATVSRKIIRS